MLQKVELFAGCWVRESAGERTVAHRRNSSCEFLVAEWPRRVFLGRGPPALAQRALRTEEDGRPGRQFVRCDVQEKWAKLIIESSFHRDLSQRKPRWRIQFVPNPLPAPALSANSSSSRVVCLKSLQPRARASVTPVYKPVVRVPALL